MDTESQFRTLQQLQQADHDTLVRIETKMDSSSEELKRIVSDFSAKYADHETRLRVLEKDIESFSPEKVIEQLKNLQKNVTSQKINWKVVGVMVSVLAFFISIAATLLAAYITSHPSH